MTNKIGINKLDANADIAVLQVGIANAHRATFCSVMGEHTPGMNSDAFAVNLGLKTVDQKNTWLSLVCDGMSGNQLSVDNLGGQLAAMFLVRELPILWDSISDQVDVSFSAEVIFPSTAAISSMSASDVYFWLIKKLNYGKELKAEIVLKILIEQKELFLRNNDNKIKIEDIAGKSAQEIANLLLINKEQFLASLKLAYCLYEAVDRFVPSFTNKCIEQAEKTEENWNSELMEESSSFQALSTMTGVVELENEYLLFAVGDSRSFVVDEMGLVRESLTDKFSNFNTLTSCLGCTIESNNIIPVTPVKNGMMTGISIRFVNKNEGQSKQVIVSITDGLGSTDEAASCVANIIAAQIEDISGAIAETMGKSRNDDEVSFKRNAKYVPDDKTIVIIEKISSLTKVAS